MYVWDEHAHYSPDGKKIIWMSNKGYNIAKGLKAEFWLMDADGSNPKQLTFFNQPGDLHYISGKISVAADSSWSPDGRQIMGLINFTTQGKTDWSPDGTIVVMTLK